MNVNKSRAELKRDSILDAARATFLTQGYKATSMDDIAIRAQVSKKTVYHHFNNKETLFRKMLVQHWLEVFSSEPILFDDTKPVSNNLRKFANVFLNFIYQENTIYLIRILISEANQFKDLTGDILVENQAPFTRALTLFLKEKAIKGELTIKNPERAAGFFIGLLKENHFWPMMLGFIKSAEPKNKNVLINEAVDMFINFYSHK